MTLPRLTSLLAIWLGVGLAVSGAAQSTNSTVSGPAAEPVIQTEDVDRFYKVYDAAAGHPTADQLQHDYIDPGSDGLHHFAQVRNISGTTIAKTLAEHPEIYSDARRCMVVLPRVRQRLQVAFRELGRLYPEARFPPVTIAVGRGRPVAIGGPANGVVIGLEALCATDWLNQHRGQLPTAANPDEQFNQFLARQRASSASASASVELTGDNDRDRLFQEFLKWQAREHH